MNEEYLIQERISSYDADIYAGVRKCDNKRVLIKKVSYQSISAKEKQQAVDEVNILAELKHNNVVKYYQHHLNKATAELYIITEFCEKGNLADYIYRTRKEEKRIGQDTIWKIFSQIVLGLQGIHTDKKACILHRNIKPSSVFIDANDTVKLGDFAFVKKLRPDQHFSATFLPETKYLSPEQIQSGLFTKKTDIWAVGCLLYEMCMGLTPFHGNNEFEIAHLIRDSTPRRTPYSNELNRVIFWCLEKKSENRPTVEDLQGVPEVNLRIREKRYAEQYSLIKKRQGLLEEKIKELNQLESQLNEEKRMNLSKIQSQNQQESKNVDSNIRNLQQTYNSNRIELGNRTENRGSSELTKRSVPSSLNRNLENKLTENYSKAQFYATKKSIPSSLLARNAYY